MVAETSDCKEERGGTFSVRPSQGEDRHRFRGCIGIEVS